MNLRLSDFLNSGTITFVHEFRRMKAITFDSPYKPRTLYLKCTGEDDFLFRRVTALYKSYKNPVTSTPYKVTVMLCTCREVL